MIHIFSVNNLLNMPNIIIYIIRQHPMPKILSETCHTGIRGGCASCSLGDSIPSPGDSKCAYVRETRNGRFMCVGRMEVIHMIHTSHIHAKMVSCEVLWCLHTRLETAHTITACVSAFIEEGRRACISTRKYRVKLAARLSLSLIHI